jgi:hypothetical protein
MVFFACSQLVYKCGKRKIDLTLGFACLFVCCEDDVKRKIDLWKQINVGSLEVIMGV